MATLFGELTDLTQSLEANGIEYAVCGGLAMAIHGFVRATLDIDLLILPDSLEKACEIAEEKGFDICGLDASFKETAIEIGRVSKIDDEGEVLSLDFLLVAPQVEDVWENRIKMTLAGKNYSIVWRDGLIKMKILAGRPQDLFDIERLENEAG